MTFENYILDRKYVRNVSPKTLAWYKDIQHAFPALNIESPQLFRQSAMEAVRGHLARGVKPVSVNSWLTGVRAYGIWLWKERHLKEKPRIELLKYEQKILATLSPIAVQSLLHWRPKGSGNIIRAHLIALTILDTGLRASEVLGLSKENCDLDNLVFKVVGKGNKHRSVPFSPELRKHLFRFTFKGQQGGKIIPTNYISGTNNDTKVSVRNLERDFKILGKKLAITGVRFSPHTLRHTFACEYLKRGGNLEFLRRILGHTSLVTTQKYLKSLGVDDLGAVHSGLSPLTRR